jgi:hypothetical protein
MPPSRLRGVDRRGGRGYEHAPESPTEPSSHRDGRDGRSGPPRRLELPTGPNTLPLSARPEGEAGVAEGPTGGARSRPVHLSAVRKDGHRRGSPYRTRRRRPRLRPGQPAGVVCSLSRGEVIRGSLREGDSGKLGVGANVELPLVRRKRPLRPLFESSAPLFRLPGSPGRPGAERRRPGDPDPIDVGSGEFVGVGRRAPGTGRAAGQLRGTHGGRIVSDRRSPGLEEQDGGEDHARSLEEEQRKARSEVRHALRGWALLDDRRPTRNGGRHGRIGGIGIDLSRGGGIQAAPGKAPPSPSRFACQSGLGPEVIETV